MGNQMINSQCYLTWSVWHSYMLSLWLTHFISTGTSHSLRSSHLTYLFLLLTLCWFLISLTSEYWCSRTPNLTPERLLFSIYSLVISIGLMTSNIISRLTTPKVISSAQDCLHNSLPSQWFSPQDLCPLLPPWGVYIHCNDYRLFGLS